MSRQKSIKDFFKPKSTTPVDSEAGSDLNGRRTLQQKISTSFDNLKKRISNSRYPQTSSSRDTVSKTRPLSDQSYAQHLPTSQKKSKSLDRKGKGKLEELSSELEAFELEEKVRSAI
jgi:hypothetical protein